MGEATQIPSDGVDLDSRGELGHRARAGRDSDKMSLPAQGRRPNSALLSRSTPSDGRLVRRHLGGDNKNSFL